MNENLSGVGERISQRMKELNFKQKDLSEKTGISKNAISNYINDLRIPKTLECYKISQQLLVSMEWLLTGLECKNTCVHNVQVVNSDTSQLTEEEKDLILKFRHFDELDKEFIKDTINNLLKRLEKSSTSYYYTPGDEDAAAVAEESAEYNVKKHA